MTFKKISFFVVLLLVIDGVQAQQSEIYTNDLVDYQKALSLYNNKQYQAAQVVFESIKENVSNSLIASDCAYYSANCAVRLNQQNAEDLVLDFVETYPTSTKRNSAILDVANFYFSNGKYAYARKWYDRVDDNKMNRSELEKFYFNYGYALYVTGDQQNATSFFNRVITSEDYGSQAKYYIGFMAYQGDDYDTANTYFDQVKGDDNYKDKLSYYQADLNFKLGKFEKAIALATAQLDNSSAQEKSQLSKIIGESYFNLGSYAKSVPYLKAYKGNRGKWNNIDYYQLGYAYYKENDFESAVSEFNKIIDGDNAVAQNAYYHLGESYINLSKTQEALNAFRLASQMDYDLQIQEDSWFNYAKISYEIGNPYQSIPQVITSYLEKYPKSLYKEEAEALLIDSYITSRNYKEAIRLLEHKTSFEHRVAYQKVTFYRGIEVYNEGDYIGAKDLFDTSIKEAKDNLFTIRATFWRAETEYHLNNFDAALLDFKQFELQSADNKTNEIHNLNYNIAYTYFKLKKYGKAMSYFQGFIEEENGDKLRLNDAYLRLGDCYFVSSDYNKAIASYDKAIDINEIESDYASFQKGISYGYDGQGASKIKGLETFIDKYLKSSLRDDAIYELANSYLKRNDIDRAMDLYNQLYTEYKNSVFIPKALLRQGLYYYRVNDTERALAKFKSVAENYPSTEDANQAVSTSRLIYMDLGRVEDYANWIKTLDYIDITDTELDNTMYLAAEKQFLENNTTRATRQLNTYLNEFPNGLHTIKSHFYLAELYSKQELPDTATSHYEYVVNSSKGEFTEQAIVKLSEIYLIAKKWDKAIPLLKRLEQEADYPQNIIYAQSNMMTAYYQNKNYTAAVNYAEKSLENTKIDAKLKSDAHLIIARSSIYMNNEIRARSAYAEVEKIASGALAAEALYYRAYFEHNEHAFKQSNTSIQKLARDYSSYKYYSAKGLVLMAKNYDALGDAFQATYILESVISNFSSYDDVISEAKLELNTIKTEAAKTNASVQPQN